MFQKQLFPSSYVEYIGTQIIYKVGTSVLVDTVKCIEVREILAVH